MYILVRDIGDRVLAQSFHFCRQELSTSELREIVNSHGNVIAVRKGDENILDVLDRRCGINFHAQLVDRRDVNLLPGNTLVVVQPVGAFDEKKNADDMIRLSTYSTLN